MIWNLGLLRPLMLLAVGVFMIGHHVWSRYYDAAWARSMSVELYVGFVMIGTAAAAAAYNQWKLRRWRAAAPERAGQKVG